MIIKSQPCFQAMVLSPTVAARVSSKKCGNSSRLSEEEIAKFQDKSKWKKYKNRQKILPKQFGSHLLFK